jgi:phospho-N-acetylmuramoyl-pentapeptide-transferase
MGGLLIFGCVFLSTFLWAAPNVWVVVAMFVYTALTAVGFRDDYLKVVRKSRDGISSGEKMLWQTLITLIALAVLLWHPLSAHKIRELWLPFVKYPVWQFAGGFGVVALFVLMFFWVVGFSNAINLTDGLDGLAIGCTVIAAGALAVLTYVSGHATFATYLELQRMPQIGELTIFCGAMVGSAIGFLWYNAHPAEVFMGDVGSLALGGAIGAVAVMIKQELLLPFIGGIFVVEALSVILQVGSYKLRKKRIFKMAPIHHHFELLGWSESKVIVRFWIASLVFALFALTTLKLR